MNTIKTEKIGDHIIITGARMLSIDPKGTELGTQPKIEALPEYAEMMTAQREKGQAIQKAGQAKSRHGAFIDLKNRDEIKLAEAQSIGDEKAVALLENDIKRHTQNATIQDQIYRDQNGVTGAKNTELLEITPRFNVKQQQIKRDSPSFCEPNDGEYIDRGLSIVGCDELGAPAFLGDVDMVAFLVPESKMATGMMEVYLAKTATQQLLLSGDYIDDFRGKQYFFKTAAGDWVESEVITDLGVSKNTVVVDEYQDGAIEKADLTPEQSGEIRLQNLSVEEKAAEYESKRLSLLSEAGRMKSELEIVADPDALAKSQEFYNTELELLKTVYSI